MISAVDTNILLDVLIPGAEHAGGSKALLDEAVSQGALVLSEIVYAELAAQFGARDGLDTFLLDTGLRLERSSRSALYRASEAWMTYLEKRDSGVVQCPQCGAAQRVRCSTCHDPVSVRQHILTDFLVGAHALTHADRLLTRDRGYYRRYFDELTVAVPASPQ